MEFDGLEAHCGHAGQNPVWSAQFRAWDPCAQVHHSFWRHLTRDALVDSSNSNDFGGFSWHMNTRSGQTDWAATDRRAYLDFDKARHVRDAQMNGLYTPDLGW